ncbi:hypothetical protein M9H77_28235 [Catharanthus roseus]|uniref:Uncharacterized protein n=1 Tax=Catharanthus roseus TaxID=4058 RepID=A0ACC0AER6_CATRO|nr:hypothetical protein M9H77_28235 [Catharanthus roseus]
MRYQITKAKLPNWFCRIKELGYSGKWQEVLSLHRQMKEEGVQLTDPTIFPPVLKACEALSFIMHGKSVHSNLVKEGLDSFTSIGNSILDFYAKSGALGLAQEIFGHMRNRDSVSWNIIIHGHLSRGDYEQGLGLFFQAKIAGFVPNISTLVLVIQACRELGYFDGGKVIHGYTIQNGFFTVSSVQNCLLCMYADMGMEFADKLFDEMCERDVIAWSVIIGSYVQNDQARGALELFRQMLSDFRIEVDGQIMVNVLKACTNLRDIRMAKMVHSFAISVGLGKDLFLQNSLVDLYSKCYDVDSASKVFSKMPQKNTVSWNSLLSGFVQNNKHSEALLLFESMGETGVAADEITLVNLLQLCKYFVDVYQCKLIHSKVIRQGYESNRMVINSLIDAYAKCNNISLAWKQFNAMNQRDTVTWSTMIAAFTHCGMPEEAIAVFREMNQVEGKPNAITILSLIESCSLCVELKLSKSVHAIAIRHCLASDVEIGTAIVDMYSKCGAIEASRKSFDQIPQKNIVSWGAMIAAYGMNGLPQDALALHAKMRSQGLKPNLVITLSVLSACSHGGLVEEGLSLFRTLLQEYGAAVRLEHYSCLIDLLARAGRLDSALNLIKEIPNELRPGASAWGAILSACRNYGNSDVGTNALSRVLELEPSSSSGYLLASNMYAASGLWSHAAKMRWLVKEKGVRVLAGHSVVNVNNKPFKFVAGDKHHQLSDDLCSIIKELHWCMKIDNKNDDAIYEYC